MAACLSWVSHLWQVLCWPPISKPNVLTLRKSVCVYGCTPNILQQCQAFRSWHKEIIPSIYHYYNILVKSDFSLQYIFFWKGNVNGNWPCLFWLIPPQSSNQLEIFEPIYHLQAANSGRWSIFPDFQRTLKSWLDDGERHGGGLRPLWGGARAACLRPHVLCGEGGKVCKIIMAQLCWYCANDGMCLDSTDPLSCV